jgi:hypothetical protein
MLGAEYEVELEADDEAVAVEDPVADELAAAELADA